MLCFHARFHAVVESFVGPFLSKVSRAPFCAALLYI
jgi:hypothetical protein